MLLPEFIRFSRLVFFIFFSFLFCGFSVTKKGNIEFGLDLSFDTKIEEKDEEEEKKNVVNFHLT